jgi:hypothetical protein
MVGLSADQIGIISPFLQGATHYYRGKGNKPKIWVLWTVLPPIPPKFSEFLPFSPLFLGESANGAIRRGRGMRGVKTYT